MPLLPVVDEGRSRFFPSSSSSPESSITEEPLDRVPVGMARRGEEDLNVHSWKDSISGSAHSNGSVDRATMSNQLYREGHSQKFWDQTQPLLTASEDLSGPRRGDKGIEHDGGGNQIGKRHISTSTYRTKVLSIVGFVISITLLFIGATILKNGDLYEEKSEIEELEELPTSQESGTIFGAIDPENVYDVCSLGTKEHVRNSCDYTTTKFVVGADENGLWPKGFSWTVLRDVDTSGKQTDRAFLHIEKGEFDNTKADGRDIRCKKFVTELCLLGDYIVYANSDDVKSIQSAVNVCNSRVIADEALDFTSDGFKCSNAEFELDPSDPKQKRYGTLLQEQSMAASVSGSYVLSTSGAGNKENDGNDGSDKNAPKSTTTESPTESTNPTDPLQPSPSGTTSPGDPDATEGDDWRNSFTPSPFNPSDPKEWSPTPFDPTVIFHPLPTQAPTGINVPTYVPTPEPTQVQTLIFVPDPPEVVKPYNDTRDNTTKVVTKDIPFVFDETIKATWPTVVPTPAPSFPGAQGGTAAPSTIKEFFYPPEVDKGIKKTKEEDKKFVDGTSTNTSNFFQGIYQGVKTYDYPELFNETVRGFQYPTLAPTELPTVYPTPADYSAPVSCFMFGTLCPEVVSQPPTPLPTETAELPTAPYLRRKMSVDEQWKGEEWISSSEKSEALVDHQKLPGTWSSMLRCTLFGLKCVDENAPTTSPTAEPTLAPSWSDDHWNRTSITECHFFGLYCTDVEVPDTPEPSREPTGRAGREDDDYMYMSSVGRKKEAIGGSFLDRLFGMEEGENQMSPTEELENALEGIKHPLSLRNPIDMHEKLTKNEMEFMAE